MHFQRLDDIIVTVMGVPLTVKHALYYPPVPETDIDPSEGSFAEGGAVFANGLDISELFELPENAALLQEAIIQYMES